MTLKYSFFNVLTENVLESKRSKEFSKGFKGVRFKIQLGFSWLQNHLNFDLLVEEQI